MNLVDKGNTVLVIEHNMDVIKVADQIIDLGPEGGDEGGRIIATGSPEAVASVPGSYTGLYLREVLNNRSGYAPFAVDPIKLEDQVSVPTPDGNAPSGRDASISSQTKNSRRKRQPATKSVTTRNSRNRRVAN